MTSPFWKVYLAAVFFLSGYSPLFLVQILDYLVWVFNARNSFMLT